MCYKKHDERITFMPHIDGISIMRKLSQTEAMVGKLNNILFSAVFSGFNTLLPYCYSSLCFKQHWINNILILLYTRQ